MPDRPIGIQIRPLGIDKQWRQISLHLSCNVTIFLSIVTRSKKQRILTATVHTCCCKKVHQSTSLQPMRLSGSQVGPVRSEGRDELHIAVGWISGAPHTEVYSLSVHLCEALYGSSNRAIRWCRYSAPEQFYKWTGHYGRDTWTPGVLWRRSFSSKFILLFKRVLKRLSGKVGRKRAQTIWTDKLYNRFAFKETPSQKSIKPVLASKHQLNSICGSNR